MPGQASFAPLVKLAGSTHSVGVVEPAVEIPDRRFGGGRARCVRGRPYVRASTVAGTSRRSALAVLRSRVITTGDQCAPVNQKRGCTRSSVSRFTFPASPAQKSAFL